MQKSNIKELPPDSSMAKYFTGNVEIRKLVTDALTKDFETFLVTFIDGARTKLHYHEMDQVLIATEGKGVVALQTDIRMEDNSTATIKMDEVHELTEGDYVCIPAFKWHWHGASKGSSFSHLQIKKPGKTVWVD
ncbi:MAG: cupin domain-containing protein [Nitrososphaera sp.]